MARPRVKSDSSPNNGSAANIGFESTLWATADKLRNNMDASEYKHVVLGLIFLKYISDAFEEKHAALLADKKAGADPEDPDEYRAENIFWVPKVARWSHLRSSAKQPTIGKHVDDAMVAIERDNPTLKGVLPKDFARPSLDKQRLGELIDLISSIGLGDKENRAKDILGRVYEYFLSQFASAEGKKGGQFYTPQCVVRVLVEMLAPYKGRVFDPCCGSGGMFVQSEKFVEAHDGRIGDISVYGQESNTTTWRLAKMNLAIRGIDTNLGEPDSVGSFLRDQHKDLKADYVIANPPFNDSDWGGDRLREDARWKFGVPPAGNANFAWVQHFIHHLAPNGIAGFVLANGSMSSNQSGEGEIRKQIVEADMVDCMVALPGQLFYSTQIPVCLWFVTRSKVGTRGNVVGARGNAVGARCNVPLRDRRGETLFIDARKMGRLIDRVHRELTDEEISLIAGTYHAWRGDAGSTTSRPTDSTTARPMDSTTLRSPFVGAPLVGAPSRSTSSGDRHGAGTRPAPTLAAPCGSPKTGVPYADIPGFCKSADIDEIRKHGHVLTPGRYVGAAEVEDDGEPFSEKMKRLTSDLAKQFEESARLEKEIRKNLKGLGYEF